MKSVRLAIFIIIILIVFTTFQERGNSLSITEFEGTNYLQLYKNLINQYDKINLRQENKDDAVELPTNEDLNDFRVFVENAHDTCEGFHRGNEGQSFIQEVFKTTTKLKNIEELKSITTDFESEFNKYITNCALEREYFLNIHTIDTILDDKTNLNIIKGVINGSIQCESPSLQTITSSTKEINESYSKVRTYTDNLTSTYNTSTTKLNEADEKIAIISKKNSELGEETQKIMQDLQFLKSKRTTETQEIAILQRDLKEDYQALTTLETYNYYTAKSQALQGNKPISISLDKRNTWYAFQDQDEFFQFLKLLNTSNAEVRLIQDKSLDIIEKKNLIVKINASEIANSVMIDLITQNISSNNSQISALNDEQNEIKPKIDQYNAYVKQLRETDTLLRKNIASMTSALDQCKEYSLEKITDLRSKTENLNDDIKSEMKRIYSEDISDKDYFVIENPETANNLDVAQLLRILNDYANFESRFTNCTESDQLDIVTSTELLETNNSSGIFNFTIISEPVNSVDKSLDEINSNYLATQPFDQIDVNHYSSFVNRSFIENRNQFSMSEQNTFTFNLYPNNYWTQTVSSIEETHKNYECKNSSWSQVSERKKLVIEKGDCKSPPTQPIVVDYVPEKGELNKIIMTEVNKFIQTNQIKLKGECKTS